MHKRDSLLLYLMCLLGMTQMIQDEKGVGAWGSKL